MTPVLPELSRRQEEVLSLMAEGLTNREIAARLGRSHHTVKQWVSEVLRALDAGTRTEAVARYLRGLVHG